jgi:hypothetical protein
MRIASQLLLLGCLLKGIPPIEYDVELSLMREKVVLIWK